MPTITQLEYVLAVHKTGHFGRAARDLGISQPTLSSQIQKVEQELGLTLFADEAVASNTVTAVNAPEGVDVAQMLNLLRTEYDVVLAGGQGSMQGSLFRFGHLGYCSEEDIEQCLDALKSALPRVGYKFAHAKA